MFKTTLKNVGAHKRRLFTTALSVLLGVAFMAGTFVLTDTINKTFDDLFATINRGIDAEVRTASAVEADGIEQRARIDASVLEQVRAVPGVKEAAGNILGYAQIVGRDGEPVGDPSQGPPTFGAIWTDSEELNSFSVVEGRAPRAATEVAIDKGTADKGGLAVGDSTKVLAQGPPVDVTVVGIVRFGNVDSPGGASITLFTDEAAQRYVAEPGKYDSIVVAAADGVSQPELVARLRGVVPDGTEVRTGAAVIADQQNEMRDNLGFFSTFMLTFALIALFVGSFIIYNTFSIIVAQRAREMALLRAIGASRRQVLASVLVESTAVGVVASALGLVAGIGVAGLLKGLLAAAGFDIPAGGTVLLPRTVVVSFVAGVGVCVVSAVLPARRASRVAPVAAMRDVAIEHADHLVRRVVVGSVVAALGLASLGVGLVAKPANAPAMVGLGAAVLFVAVAILGPVIARPVVAALGAPLPRLRGITGTLAGQNAARNPRRTSATAAALMIGVGLVAFITIFATSAKAAIDDIVDEQFRGDYVIDSPTWGMGGLDPSLADELRVLPEVQEAASVRYGPVEIDGKGTGIAAVNPSQMKSLFDVKVRDGDIDGLGVSGIAVHVDKAEEKDLRIGSTVPVRFAGHEPVDFVVKAIYEDGQMAGAWFLSQEAWGRYVPNQYDTQVFVKAADGVPAAEVRAALEGVVAGYPTATLQDNQEFKEDQAAMINQMLGLIYVLLALAVIIALMGIANTLALSVYERTRELGLLRAVGMSRRQLRSAIRWEAVIIALLGAVLGVAVGVFFGWSMVKALADEGFDTFRVPAGQLAFIALLAALCGVVAAALPARRAARLDVLQAIAVE